MFSQMSKHQRCNTNIFILELSSATLNEYLKYKSLLYINTIVTTATMCESGFIIFFFCSLLNIFEIYLMQNTMHTAHHTHNINKWAITPLVFGAICKCILKNLSSALPDFNVIWCFFHSLYTQITFIYCI